MKNIDDQIHALLNTFLVQIGADPIQAREFLAVAGAGAEAELRTAMAFGEKLGEPIPDLKALDERKAAATERGKRMAELAIATMAAVTSPPAGHA